jgi:hypothetical protein
MSYIKDIINELKYLNKQFRLRSGVGGVSPQKKKQIESMILDREYEYFKRTGKYIEIKKVHFK